MDETIVIIDESGQKTRGKVAGVSAASLTVLTPEKRIFVERSVAQIRRTDALWNGILIGTLVGAGVGWTGAGLNKLRSEHEWWGTDFGLFGSVGAAAGAVAGVLTDWATGNAPIYRTLSPSPAVAVSPWLGSNGSGVSVALRF